MTKFRAQKMLNPEKACNLFEHISYYELVFGVAGNEKY